MTRHRDYDNKPVFEITNCKIYNMNRVLRMLYFSDKPSSVYDLTLPSLNELLLKETLISSYYKIGNSGIITSMLGSNDDVLLKEPIKERFLIPESIWFFSMIYILMLMVVIVSIFIVPYSTFNILALCAATLSILVLWFINRYRLWMLFHKRAKKICRYHERCMLINQTQYIDSPRNRMSIPEYLNRFGLQVEDDY